jgi:hypothetical protein
MMGSLRDVAMKWGKEDGFEQMDALKTQVFVEVVIVITKELLMFSI